MDEEAIRERRTELSDPNLPYDVVWEIMQGSANSVRVTYVKLMAKTIGEQERQSYNIRLKRVREIIRNYNLTREEVVEHTIELEQELDSLRGGR